MESFFIAYIIVHIVTGTSSCHIVALTNGDQR
jgi:hypothetical protein